MTKLVIDYRLLKASNVPDLIEQVKWLLEQGWSPWGTLAIGGPQDNFVFAREMVLYEGDEIC